MTIMSRARRCASTSCLGPSCTYTSKFASGSSLQHVVSSPSAESRKSKQHPSQSMRKSEHLKVQWRWRSRRTWYGSWLLAVLSYPPGLCVHSEILLYNKIFNRTYSFNRTTSESHPLCLDPADITDTQGYEAADEYSSPSEEECFSDTGTPSSDACMVLDDLRTSPVPIPSDASDISSLYSVSTSASQPPSPVRRFLKMFDGRDDCGNPISDVESLRPRDEEGDSRTEDTSIQQGVTTTLGHQSNM